MVDFACITVLKVVDQTSKPLKRDYHPPWEFFKEGPMSEVSILCAGAGEGAHFWGVKAGNDSQTPAVFKDCRFNEERLCSEHRDPTSDYPPPNIIRVALGGDGTWTGKLPWQEEATPLLAFLDSVAGALTAARKRLATCQTEQREQSGDKLRPRDLDDKTQAFWSDGALSHNCHRVRWPAESQDALRGVCSPP